MKSKKQLAVTLSRIQTFEKPSIKLEQYPTDSEIAAEILWAAYHNNDIENRVAADLGCGTGILGIGALLMNAKKVHFVDIDDRPLKKLESNLKLMELSNYEIMHADVKNFENEVDVVIQNPPFGVKNAHADKAFLETAFKVSNVIYSFHKAESKNFVEKISKDNGFTISNYFEFDFPLKNTQHYHKRNLHRIKVGCFRMDRQQTLSR